MKKILTYYCCDHCGVIISWNEEDGATTYYLPRHNTVTARGGRGKCKEIEFTGTVMPIKTQLCETCAEALATALEDLMKKEIK